VEFYHLRHHDGGADGLCSTNPVSSRRNRGRLLRGRGKTLGAIDLHVASRVRERRVVLGMSQPNLAAALGISYQQLSKYEQGSNRISAGRLYLLSEVLDVPIMFFFEEIADTSTPAASLASDGHKDRLALDKTAEVVAAYRAISDPVLRRSLRQLVRALGPEPSGSAAKPSASKSRRVSRRVHS
jgi:transcriptional regulator with XRE-family HTH domain